MLNKKVSVHDFSFIHISVQYEYDYFEVNSGKINLPLYVC